MSIRAVGQALLIAGASFTAAGAEPRDSTTRAADATRSTTAVAAVRDLPRPPAQLGLVVYDVQGLLSSNDSDRTADMIEEAREIFEAMGVATSWKRGGFGTVHGAGPLREIPVILLADAPGKLSSQRDVLGLIPKSQPPAIWVFVENVKRSIGAAAADGRAVAVAVGRVVAHEMVHSLAPALGHTRGGLMRHALDRDA